MTFEQKCIEKFNNLKFDRYLFEQEKIKQYNFRNKNSRDITYDLIIEAEKSIDRDLARKEFNKYLNNWFYSYELERGLFEYTLTTIAINNKMQNSYCSSKYYHEMYNLCRNLDINDESVKNNFLLQSITGGKYNSYDIAFMPSYLIHPKRYEIIFQKMLREDDAKYNMPTVEWDPCDECKNTTYRKYDRQMRSADEPVTIFIVCSNCGKTYMQN